MNIVIWVVDSLRADHLGIYGSDRALSPSIDALAKDGVVFENAYAQATWTRPSSGTLFTGTYPAVHGAITFESRLRDNLPTLPSILHDKGFATGVFSAIGHMAASWGYNAGVDHFVHLWEEKSYASGQRSAKFIRSGEVRREAEGWMTEQISRQKPFFALLWSIDTHVPFEKEVVLRRFPKATVSDGAFRIDTIEGIWAANKQDHLQALLKAYECAVLDTDVEIGSLVDFLEYQGIYQDTLLVVLGDHGEVFNEHDRGQFTHLSKVLRLASMLPGIRKLVDRYRLVNRFGWLGHLNIIPFDEVLRVPLVIKFPDEQWRGRRVSPAVQLIDVPGTIVHLTGNEPAAKQMQGHSLLNLLKKESDWANEYTFSDSQTHVDGVRYVSVQAGKWKLIRTIKPTHSKPGTSWRRLVNVKTWQYLLAPNEVLVDTSDERRDHKQLQPGEYHRLRNIMERWLQENDRLAKESAQEAGNESVRRHLESLGYL